MKLSGGMIIDRVTKDHESRREAPSGGGVWGGDVPRPRDGGLNFEILDAIWCNLVRFGKKFTFLQLSTFVNENIVIVLDSGICIVTYYFIFCSRPMNSLCFVL